MYIIIQTINTAKSQCSNKNKKSPKAMLQGFLIICVMDYFNNSLISIDFS